MNTFSNVSSSTKRWFALVVAPRREKSAAEALRDRDIEPFLPVTRLIRHWSDRIRILDTPIFPGYLFCRCDFESRFRVLGVPSVIEFVSFGRGPTPIPDEEIDEVRAISNSQLPLLTGPLVHAGMRVKIESGPLAGLSGILVREKDTARVVVNMEILRRSVSVEVDRTMLSVDPIVGAPIVMRNCAAQSA